MSRSTSYHIDAMAARMVMAPESLDVVVASNLFGDILTDLGAAIQGGLGFAASANINPDRTAPSMFEPVHGSAPDIAHLGIANPIAAIWSGAMMLDHLGEKAAAGRIMTRDRGDDCARHRRDPGKDKTEAITAAVLSALGLTEEDMTMKDLKDTSLFRELGLIGGEWVRRVRQDASRSSTRQRRPSSARSLTWLDPRPARRSRRPTQPLAPWRKKTHAERAALLEAWHWPDAREHRRSRADPHRRNRASRSTEARGEIRYGASFVKWFAEEARRIGGTTIPSPTPDRRIVVLKEPVGVCGIITPVEFSQRDDHPQGRAGARRRLHRGDQALGVHALFGAGARRAGRTRRASPPGVINIVTGMPAEIGNEIMANETVRKISFTGSTRVGSLLMRGAADSVKRLSLELGGNAPFIVFDDADLDLAVEGAIASKFRNGGQTCVCANRILVQAGVYDAFAAKLAARVNRP